MNKKQINDFYGGHTCIDTDNVDTCKKQLNALYGANSCKKDYTKCKTCGHCQLCFNNDILGLCKGTFYVPLIEHKKIYDNKCKTCGYYNVCADYNLLGQCKGVRYFDKNLVADYSTVMTFIPTPYPKKFKGKFKQGYNEAIEEIRLRIKEYYEGRE